MQKYKFVKYFMHIFYLLCILYNISSMDGQEKIDTFGGDNHAWRSK